MAPRHQFIFKRFHLIVRMKILLFGIWGMAMFMNCSDKAPIKPPAEEPPFENDSLRRIVFSAKDEQGQYKLYVINENGSGLKEIFSPNASVIGDLWVSRRGTSIVCCVNTVALPDANMQLFLVNIDGSGFRQITHYQNGILEEPQWFPDDEEILFGRFEPYGAQFYRIRDDGSKLTRLTVDDLISHRYPRLSPDEKNCL